MTVPATPQHVVARWRPLTPAEETITYALLADAWLIVQSRFPTIQDRLDAVPPTVDVEAVRMVLASMVLRVLRNPDGKTQESIEDYSYTVNSAVASGQLYVTDDEFRLLAVSSTGGTAFTIRPYGEPGYTSYSSTWPAAL